MITLIISSIALLVAILNLVAIHFNFYTKCNRCKKRGAKRRPQLTQYLDEELNWDCLCESCQEGADEYWQERWDEYYSGLM